MNDAQNGLPRKTDAPRATSVSADEMLRCHRDGWEAFRAGRLRGANPYYDGRAVAWNNGWKDAHREFRRGSAA